MHIHLVRLLLIYFLHILRLHVDRGAAIDLNPLPVQRFSSNQVEHFIEFILSPIVSIDLPFGERTYKLSTGEKVVVPNMIRNMIHSRIIDQYRIFCQSTTNGEFSPLSDAVLFNILRKCPAAVRKSLSGLDNITADGANAFDELVSICDQLSAFGESSKERTKLTRIFHHRW